MNSSFIPNFKFHVVFMKPLLTNICHFILFSFTFKENVSSAILSGLYNFTLHADRH